MDDVRKMIIRCCVFISVTLLFVFRLLRVQRTTLNTTEEKQFVSVLSV